MLGPFRELYWFKILFESLLFCRFSAKSEISSKVWKSRAHLDTIKECIVCSAVGGKQCIVCFAVGGLAELFIKSSFLVLLTILCYTNLTNGIVAGEAKTNRFGFFGVLYADFFFSDFLLILDFLNLFSLYFINISSS